MTSSCAKLCSKVLEETFGGVVHVVGGHLLDNGPCNLRQILTGLKTKVPVSLVQSSLKTMVQHFIVEVKVSENTGEILYAVNTDRVLEVLRFSKYSLHVENTICPSARYVLEVIIRTGQLPASKILYILGNLADKTDPVDETDLLGKLKEGYRAVQLLAIKRLIIRVQPPDKGEWEKKDKDEEANKASKEKILSPEMFNVPDIELQKILDKLLQRSEAKLDEFPDSGILWTLNISQLHAEMRDAMVLQGLERKFRSIVDTRVVKVLMEAGFERHPWEWEGRPVTLPEIQDRLVKAGGAGESVTAMYISDNLDVVEDDPSRLLTRLSNTHGGHFSFNMKTAVTHLFWSTVDRVIVEKHGYQALRIFRLIKSKDFVEQDDISEQGMIPSKDAKHLTYKLVEDRFIQIKEVRKSYAASAPPGKSAHVFCVEPNQIIQHLQESCYQAILNMKLKSNLEDERIARLAAKEDRISRILRNMASHGRSEEQIQEVYDLVTPPERKLINQHRSSVNQLLSGAIQVEETLFVLDVYKKFFVKKLPVKKTK